MPAVSAQDRQVIVDLAKRSDIKSEIFAFARCMVDDVKRAADCGVKGVVIEIPCNEEMITKAYGWTMERALELSIQASLAAKEAGLYTVFFPIDMTRASMKWSLDLLEHVADNGHMDALAIVDTMGASRASLSSCISMTTTAWAPPTPSWAWPPARMWPILPSVPWASGPATHPMKMWCFPC